MVNEETPWLIEVRPSPRPRKRKLKAIQHNIWTQNKAQLIQRYLYYFVMITKSGVYIDAFAGPQELHGDISWAAKLVIETEPAWLQDFHLFEIAPESVRKLEELRAHQSFKRGKHIHIHAGDVNQKLPKMLKHYPISSRKAAFCLLDQRTTECDWATVQTVAKHKKRGHKVELFYFLGEGWMARAFSGMKVDKPGDLGKWWGRDDWGQLEKMDRAGRLKAFVDRFENELGYVYVNAYPIFSKEVGGRLMFYMIHATDHYEASELMVRAHNKIHEPLDSKAKTEVGAWLKGLERKAKARKPQR